MFVFCRSVRLFLLGFLPQKQAFLPVFLLPCPRAPAGRTGNLASQGLCTRAVPQRGQAFLPVEICEKHPSVGQAILLVWACAPEPSLRETDISTVAWVVGVRQSPALRISLEPATVPARPDQTHKNNDFRCLHYCSQGCLRILPNPAAQATLPVDFSIQLIVSTTDPPFAVHRAGPGDFLPQPADRESRARREPGARRTSPDVPCRHSPFEAPSRSRYRKAPPD